MSPKRRRGRSSVQVPASWSGAPFRSDRPKRQRDGSGASPMLPLRPTVRAVVPAAFSLGGFPDCVVVVTMVGLYSHSEVPEMLQGPPVTEFSGGGSACGASWFGS